MNYTQTVDDLLNELVTLDNLPINQQTFTGNVLTQYMDDGLQNDVVPIIMSCREEYFVTTYSFVVGPQANNGLVTLPIPGESAAFRVRDVYAYNPQSGNTDFNWDSAIKCKRFNPDTLPAFSTSLYTPIFIGNAFPQYYIENNTLRFFPNLTQQLLIKVRVLKSPNHLVQYNQCCGQVLSKNGANTVTVDNVPSGPNIPPNVGNGRFPYGTDWTGFASTVNAPTLDVIQGGGRPFNFRTSLANGYVMINKPIINVSGVNVTLDADTYNSVQVGDFLVTNNMSPFLQYVPFEAYNLVKLQASLRALNAQGDWAGWSIRAQVYNKFAQDFKNSITPKVESMPKKVGGGNRGGILGNLGWRRTL